MKTQTPPSGAGETGSSAALPASTAALRAKGALRRLAQAHLEPTPENYARAYAEEAGESKPEARNEARQEPAWPALLERIVRNLERGGRQWTGARRKESLYRVLDGSRSDAQRLAQRLQSLVQAWESDRPHEGVEAREAPDTPEAPEAPDAPVGEDASAPAPQPAPGSKTLHPAQVRHAGVSADPAAWTRVGAEFNSALRDGLGHDDARAAELAARLVRLGDGLARDGATPDHLSATRAVTAQARRWFGQRHEVVRQLNALNQELAQGLVDLAEDDSWARGQCAALRAHLAEGPTLRGLREAGAALADTRQRQRRAKAERQAAREALKHLLTDMLGEVDALGRQAGGYESAVERHAEAIANAGSIEGLATIAEALLADSRAVRRSMQGSIRKLQDDHQRAGELEARVRELESELQRAADAASTDALTQVANRRGLAQAFAAEAARATAEGAPLAVALLDIDNFKKLNDRLGHAAGDVALRSLAAAVRERLRPQDHVARFGGEEFVVMLPATSLSDAALGLTRLQRGLSASLFMHEGEEVFVTFSAGVTAWRPGEALEAAVARADEALYEAKRTGKNKTCQA